MKLNNLLPFGLVMLSLCVTGCGNDKSAENTTMVGSENTTNSAISNNINGVFDGYGYNTDEYNLENTTYDINYKKGYKSSNNGTNSRFGEGMKGAENIKGNDNNPIKGKNDLNNIGKDIGKDVDKGVKDVGKDIKDTIKS